MRIEKEDYELLRSERDSLLKQAGKVGKYNKWVDERLGVVRGKLKDAHREKYKHEQRHEQ